MILPSLPNYLQLKHNCYYNKCLKKLCVQNDASCFERKDKSIVSKEITEDHSHMPPL